MSEENTQKTQPEESKTLTKTPKKASAKKSTKKVDPQDDFLTNFNWHQYQEGIDELDEKQIKEFEKLVEKNFVDTSDDNIILGEVIHMTEKDVIIDINAKSEGVISKNEFRYNPDLKLGDKVYSLDANFSGHITKIDGSQINIKTEDGFEMKFDISELIKVDDELFNSYPISKLNYKEIQFQNTDEKKKNKFKINKHRKDITVVDLHIDKLISFQRNLKKYEILSFQLKIAKKKLDLAILNGTKRIIFIHGIGQGILKFELEKILRLYNNLEFYPANFKEYGYGATEVSILTKKS